MGINRIILAAILSVAGLVSCKGAQDDADIVVRPDKSVAKVSPLFWGTNFLFWIEDDAALADGSIVKSLKELPCTMLRYPGGTVADNFHWRTNTLDNTAMFPYEEGGTESDFDEFMAFCGRVGAEPLLVVNTQSWYLKRDIEGGAREASEWVRYCKEKGYKVKYWEIGNETYWHTVMTAREYGALANVYAKAMKAEDPDIIISVNGGWDIEMTGNKERTDSSLWEGIRQEYLGLRTEADYKAFKDRTDALVTKPWTTGENKWWHDLITECGDNIDMVSVHWYYHDNVLKHIDKKINELKAYLKEMKPGKDYLVCLSEYNCNTPEPDLRMSGFAESLGRFLNAGVDMACFWPLRIGGSSKPTKNRSMLGMDSKARQYPWTVMKMLQANLKGNMVKCKSPEDVFAYASVDGKDMTVVISGRRLKERRTFTFSPGARTASISAMNYVPNVEKMDVVPDAVEIKKEGSVYAVDIDPGTFTMIKIRLK